MNVDESVVTARFIVVSLVWASSHTLTTLFTFQICAGNYSIGTGGIFAGKYGGYVDLDPINRYKM